jgi:hypothetical protein
MNGEPIETFYQQPGAWAAAEEYQAQGYFTRVGRWKGNWALWVEKKDGRKNRRMSSAPTRRLEVADG